MTKKSESKDTSPKLTTTGGRRVKAKESDYIDDPLFGRVPPSPVDKDGYYVGDAPSAAESAATIGVAETKTDENS